MNKKAMKKVLETIINLVLVTMALLVLFGIFKGLTSLFTNKDEASINNLNELANLVENLEKGDTKEMPIYVKEEKFIVGFGSTITLVPAQCDLEKQVKKPIDCGTRPCLCLCEDDECDKKTCKTFDGNFEFKGDPCQSAVIIGQKKPQTVFLRKRADEFLICTQKC